MKNLMLDFYLNNKVTTEHIAMERYDEYIQKREKLYLQLGIPLLVFKNADIIEIGPGVGHNTLPLITEWKAKHIDMLEPNVVAASQLKVNFDNHKIDNQMYRILPIIWEEYDEEKKYDIVIAEGYIQFAANYKEFLNKIEKYTHQNSIVIITCSDEIGLYVERMKRIVGQYAVKDIEKLEDKVEHLNKLWNGEKYGNNLKGMTRSSKEWILDMIFNEASMFEHVMTMKDAIEEMADEFNVLGASQNIFTDYSWYKDLSFDCLESFKNQYDAKKHIFLIAGDYSEVIRTVTENVKLERAIKDTVEYAKEVEKGESININKFMKYIDRVSEISENEKLIEYNKELKEILCLYAKGQNITWDNYSTWKYTFGKSMQYISFERK